VSFLLEVAEENTFLKNEKDDKNCGSGLTFFFNHGAYSTADTVDYSILQRFSTDI
jgi:hypothetical protein